MERNDYARIDEDEEEPFIEFSQADRRVIIGRGQYKIAKIVAVVLVVCAAVFGVAIKGKSPSLPVVAEFQESDAIRDWLSRDDVKKMAAVKANRPEKTESPETLFEQWKMNFGRQYETDSEESTRFQNFKSNLLRIHVLNERNPLALFGVNTFSDYNEEEKMSKKMAEVWTPETGKTNKWSSTHGKTFELPESHKWLVEDDCAACGIFPEAAEWTIENHPTDFDWRGRGAVTGVKNQEQCGSCWAFSSIADIEGQNYLATGQLRSFSEQQLVSCSTDNWGCNGGFPFSAMEYAESVGGVVGEKVFPYAAVSEATPWDAKGVDPASDPVGSCGADFVESQQAEGSAVGQVGGVKVVSVSGTNEDFMALALAKNGPLSMGLNAIGMEHYIHGIVGCETIAGKEYCDAGMIDDPTNCDAHDIDHAVALVGFGVDNGTPYWTIKNSWTAAWGEEGYYRLERGVNKCGVADMVVHSIHDPET